MNQKIKKIEKEIDELTEKIENMKKTLKPFQNRRNYLTRQKSMIIFREKERKLKKEK